MQNICMENTFAWDGISKNLALRHKGSFLRSVVGKWGQPAGYGWSHAGITDSGELGGLFLAKIFPFSKTQIPCLLIKRVAFDGLGFGRPFNSGFCQVK